MSLKMRKNRSPKPPEPCLLTECMQVIAGAWAPNVIWCLRAGPRRFNELKADIPPVSAKILSARLSELERRGVLTRTAKPTSPPSVEYELTDLGCELIPALEAIVEVGHKLKALRGDHSDQRATNQTRFTAQSGSIVE
ncbi:winged helix-turn-helix transcriptional regulator [Roseibium denhamense]|uniref:Transcriptional regulator, HxlR family n=2 Tax=Roseibium denhamense TaxID=76305 RepID=A0ABY1P2Y9_9HYPH|nr:helix-turn-helix domain-containing protein [Roseibium denhamense]SMP25167.1 transcriptional regulator, HxlR family [Roseibium denhamense]